MRKLLQFILKILSKAVIKKYKPLVIGITGSVGKTSTKEAVYRVLADKFHVAKNEENLNNEFGFPVAILMPGSRCNLEDYYADSKFRTLIFYIYIFKNALQLLSGLKKYPDFLVFEYSAEKPGDIDYLVDIARPKIGVVTAVGELPVHLEFYSGPEEVAKEKSKLIQALPSDGFAVLNYDDEIVFRMKDLSKAQTIAYGFNEGAKLWASDLMYFIDPVRSSLAPTLTHECGGLAEVPVGLAPGASETSNGVDLGEDVAGGISFKVNYEKNVVPFRLMNALGRHQIYAALAGAAVGLHLEMNLVEISQALEKLEFPKQRMKLVKGIKNSLVIDDSYNASPLSTHAALDALKEFGDKVIAKTGVGRKIAILGDMRELGVFTERAHRLIGNLAGEKAEYLFTVGPAAKFIADSAFNQLPRENIMSFNDADEAKEIIRGFIQEGDIILVKGSRLMELEKIVQALTA